MMRDSTNFKIRRQRLDTREKPRKKNEREKHRDDKTYNQNRWEEQVGYY
jgi:hypothetical protein